MSYAEQLQEIKRASDQRRADAGRHWAAIDEERRRAEILQLAEEWDDQKACPYCGAVMVAGRCGWCEE